MQAVSYHAGHDLSIMNNKKFELMLMRRTKAYSSSGSR